MHPPKIKLETIRLKLDANSWVVMAEKKCKYGKIY
jgi:hypothetical protein